MKIAVAGSVITALVALSIPVKAATCPHPVDVDGDGGHDFIVGVPGEDVGSASNAGIIQIFRGDPDGGYKGVRTVTQQDLGLTSEDGDRFGASVIMADLTNSATSCYELVIGIPGENNSEGRVAIVKGTSSGLDFNNVTVLRQGLGGVDGTPEAGDRFGEKLADVGDNGTDSLVISAPGENIGSIVDAGIVHVLPITSTGLGNGRVLQQGSGPTSGSPETGDQFGSSLTGTVDYLAVGVPREDIGADTDTGMVHVFNPRGTQQLRAIHQDATGIPGTGEDADRFGWALAPTHDCSPGAFGLAIGTPGENVGSVVDAGSVTVIDLGEEGPDAEVWTQGTDDIPDSVQTGDEFGYALAFGAVHLAVGAPGETVNGRADAGWVGYLAVECGHGVNPGFTTAMDQDTPGMAGTAEAGDRFGAALTYADYHISDNNIPPIGVIGVPGEDLAGASNAGMVSIAGWDSGTFYPSSLTFSQDQDFVPGEAEDGDGFGSTLW